MYIKYFCRILSVLCCVIPVTLEVQAHEPDHSYIFLSVFKNEIQGRYEILTSDLNRELGINLPKKIRESDLEPYRVEIENFMKKAIQFSDGSKIYSTRILSSGVQVVDDLPDDFVKFEFELENIEEVPEDLTITYQTFFDQYPKHRGILVQEYNWRAGIVNNHTMISDIFTNSNRSRVLSLTESSIWKGFWTMIKLGIWHIWIGLDHILFLVALALPSVVRRRERLTDLSIISDQGDAYSKSWQPVARFRPAAIYILTIVTFFTIAHSITLAVAALGVLDLPSRYVESVIALSIGLAAFHNIKPIFGRREWLIAFIFGLFHGFGFASVLGDKGLGGDYLVLSLLGFNLGVEIGQVLILSVVFPLLFFIRKWKIYPKILTYGSGLLIIISLHWTIERLFEVDIPVVRWANKIIAPIKGIFA